MTAQIISREVIAWGSVNRHLASAPFLRQRG
jgi:hypothetical protein